jgi:hypothetical protein
VQRSTPELRAQKYGGAALPLSYTPKIQHSSAIITLVVFKNAYRFGLLTLSNLTNFLLKIK